MNWFEKMKSGLKTLTKKDIPSGVWVKCEACGEMLYQKELVRCCWVCYQCKHHFRIGHAEYVQILLDEGSFEELNADISSADPLRYPHYRDKLREGKKATGMNSALRTGTGRINGHHAAFGVMDFRFVGGSMGSVVGEKFARLVDVAIRQRYPLIVVASSGGARMQESILSLMQMAKTSAKLAQLSEEGLLYISVMTHPTTGGVTASFSMVGDIHLAEPNALIGFAGPRIIKETLGKNELPEGFQRAESLLKHGFIDRVVPRTELKETLSYLIEMLASKPEETGEKDTAEEQAKLNE